MSDLDSSVVVDRAKIAKEKIASISPSFCLAKWAMVSIDLTRGLTQSCYHPPTHKIPEDQLKTNPSVLHNTSQKLNERKQMLMGTRPKGCEYCWTIEDLPGDHFSDRHVRSGEPWLQGAYKDIEENALNRNFLPKNVEVNFNSTCNLKCAYCGPTVSTTWAKEAKEFGAYPTIVPHNDFESLQGQGLIPLEEDNPYVEAFWRWWPELYPNLTIFRMTGGEPLLDKNTYRVLDYCQEHKNENLEIWITSNFSVPRPNVGRFVKQAQSILEKNHLKRFRVFVSIDTLGPQAEYIRFGLDIEKLKANVDEYLLGIDDSLVTFIMTFNILSLPKGIELLKYFLDLQKRHNKFYNRLFIDIPFLRGPEWLSVQNAPPEMISYVNEMITFMESNITKKKESHFVGFNWDQVNQMKRIKEWILEGVEKMELKKRKVNFYRFFNEYDKRKGTDFLRTFPEFKNFYTEAKKLNQDFDSGDLQF